MYPYSWQKSHHADGGRARRVSTPKSPTLWILVYSRILQVGPCDPAPPPCLIMQRKGLPRINAHELTYLVEGLSSSLLVGKVSPTEKRKGSARNDAHNINIFLLRSNRVYPCKSTPVSAQIVGTRRYTRFGKRRICYHASVRGKINEIGPRRSLRAGARRRLSRAINRAVESHASGYFSVTVGV